MCQDFVDVGHDFPSGERLCDDALRRNQPCPVANREWIYLGAPFSDSRYQSQGRYRRIWPNSCEISLSHLRRDPGGRNVSSAEEVEPDQDTAFSAYTWLFEHRKIVPPAFPHMHDPPTQGQPTEDVPTQSRPKKKQLVQYQCRCHESHARRSHDGWIQYQHAFYHATKKQPTGRRRNHTQYRGSTTRLRTAGDERAHLQTGNWESANNGQEYREQDMNLRTDGPLILWEVPQTAVPLRFGNDAYKPGFEILWKQIPAEVCPRCHAPRQESAEEDSEYHDPGQVQMINEYMYGLLYMDY